MATALVLAALGAAPAGASAQQAPARPDSAAGPGIAHVAGSAAQPHLARAVTIRADNDAFDFQMPPWDRPDEDYTSGVRIVYANVWRPWWSTHLWRDVPHCTGTGMPCAVSLAWVGQNIYTAERDTNGLLETTNARPSAGWLFYGEEYRRIGAASEDAIRLTLGVTGPPSLAQYTQKLAHMAAPAFNRPIDWRHQLQFEPGVMLSYERAGILGSGEAGPFAIQVVPAASATVGNVRTGATAGVRVRAGINLRSPWLPAPIHAPPELVLDAGVTGVAVAYNLFLDGGPGPHVGHEPFYAERTVGIHLTAGALMAGYRLVWDGRTYAAGHEHTWGSIVGGIAVER